MKRLNEILFHVGPTWWFDLVVFTVALSLSLVTVSLLARSEQTRWLIASDAPKVELAAAQAGGWSHRNGGGGLTFQKPGEVRSDGLLSHRFFIFAKGDLFGRAGEWRLRSRQSDIFVLGICMRKDFLALATWAAILWAGGVPLAQETAKTHVDATVLCDVASVKAGDFTLAVVLKTQADWHIYWRNPGCGVGYGVQGEFAGRALSRMRWRIRCRRNLISRGILWLM